MVLKENLESNINPLLLHLTLLSNWNLLALVLRKWILCSRKALRGFCNWAHYFKQIKLQAQSTAIYCSYNSCVPEELMWTLKKIIYILQIFFYKIVAQNTSSHVALSSYLLHSFPHAHTHMYTDMHDKFIPSGCIINTTPQSSKFSPRLATCQQHTSRLTFSQQQKQMHTHTLDYNQVTAYSFIHKTHTSFKQRQSHCNTSNIFRKVFMQFFRLTNSYS